MRLEVFYIQFHKRVLRASFNSKLVRLEATAGPFRIRSGRMFQFQTGAIRSVANSFSILSLKDVSIPNWCD